MSNIIRGNIIRDIEEPFKRVAYPILEAGRNYGELPIRIGNMIHSGVSQVNNTVSTVVDMLPFVLILGAIGMVYNIVKK